MNSYELFIGLRYTRAKRRGQFISFISTISMAGIALGVAALIVVLSVMNGFQHELRTRILGVASHIQITGGNNSLSDWPGMVKFVQGSKQVKGAAPYIMEQGMLSFDQAVQGAVIRGILPAEEDRVADIGAQMKVGKLSNLKPGEFGIVLGLELAQSLGANMGDKIVLMAPQGQFTPAGIVPRLKQFTVVGIFQVGMYEYDASLALIHMDDAAKLYRMGDQVSGVRLKLENLDDAPEIARDLAKQLTAFGAYYVSDWTEEHANFFRAVRMEKRVMFVIMTFFLVVVAFNIVSTLVMAVNDKKADIAILRTLGASPRSIMKIFIVQGFLIGTVGTLLGALLGIILALNISTIVPFIENLFGVHFLSKEVYYISELPSQLQTGDVITITLVSLVLSLLATLYPSWRAANTNPAEALRYE
jgi:lipoprotein-releasing system permease protein